MSAVVTGLAGIGLTRALTGLGRRLPEAARAPWARRNHAGAPVTLLEGPVVVLAVAATATTGARDAGTALVVLAPGLLGGLDDLVGDGTTKGLRGHLGALRRGRVTTGALKILGLGATAVLAAHLETRGSTRQGVGQSVAGTAVDAVVVAGTANLVNLLDLRPGRALKVTTTAGALLSVPTASRPLGAALVGVGLGALPEDLAGETMLGDCGANALGALVGLALVRGLGPRGRVAVAGVLTGLTLLSERVSFTRVIESTPVLRELDAWGRPR